MHAPDFRRTPRFPRDSGLIRHLAPWPGVLTVAETRLGETLQRITTLTVEEVAVFPERTDYDWPDLERLGLRPTRQSAARIIWSEVLTAVERRVETTDPAAGGFNEMYCWPVWRIYDRHWLAVVEAAGLYAIEPLLRETTRWRFETQVRLWRSTGLSALA